MPRFDLPKARGDRAGGRAALRSSFRQGARDVSIGAAAKIHRAADSTREIAQSHHERHRDAWVAKRFGDLLTKSSNTLSYAPPGINSDPKTALMAQARNAVAQKQATRLARIETARNSMLASGKMRATRRIDWSGAGTATTRSGGSRRDQGRAE